MTYTGLSRGTGRLSTGPAALPRKDRDRSPVVGDHSMENAYSDHTGNQEEFGAIDRERLRRSA